MRRRGALITAAIVLAVLAAGTAAFLLRSGHGAHLASSQATGSAAPPVALATIRRLTSANAAAQRTALTPELNSVLPPGRLFPASTIFTPNSRGWHQSGAYANVTGSIREPGRPAEPVEIGLVLRRGRWLVTFEGQI